MALYLQFTVTSPVTRPTFAFKAIQHIHTASMVTTRVRQTLVIFKLTSRTIETWNIYGCCIVENKLNQNNMCVRMFACIYVCTYVRRYVCVHVPASFETIEYRTFFSVQQIIKFPEIIETICLEIRNIATCTLRDFAEMPILSRGKRKKYPYLEHSNTESQICSLCIPHGCKG